MSTRFKGASSGEILSQSTVLNQDMIQTRHAVGNTMEDSDKGLPLSVIQSCPVALCSTSASTIKKTATVQNFTDFTLLSGREVIVYMSNGNSASEPTMNINGSGDIPLETSYWNAGTFMKLRYVEVDINGTTLKRWLVDQGASNTASQLNGALTNALAGKLSVEKSTSGTITLKRSSTYLCIVASYTNSTYSELMDFITIRNDGGVTKFNVVNKTGISTSINTSTFAYSVTTSGSFTISAIKVI